MKHRFHLAALLALTLAPAAHALNDEEPLSMRYEEPIQSGSPPSSPVPGALAGPRPMDACTLYVSRIEDQRRYPTYVGNVSFSLQGPLSTPLIVRSIRGADGRDWTTGALKAMSARGVQVRIGEAPAAAAKGHAVAAVGLKFVQAWTAELNILSHVILRVRYADGAATVDRDYHGMGNKLNWANGNGEFMTALNMAMSEALAAFAADAAAVCVGKDFRVRTVGSD